MCVYIILHVFIGFGIDQMSSSMSKKHCLGAKKGSKIWSFCGKSWIPKTSRGSPWVSIPIGSMYGIYIYNNIYTNIGGILMVNVTIYSIHGSYGICFNTGNSMTMSRLDDVEAINWTPPVGCQWLPVGKILWVHLVYEGIMNWYELSTYPLGENCFVCHFDPFACWLQKMRCHSYFFLKQSLLRTAMDL